MFNLSISSLLISLIGVQCTLIIHHFGPILRSRQTGVSGEMVGQGTRPVPVLLDLETILPISHLISDRNLPTDIYYTVKLHREDFTIVPVEIHLFSVR